MIAALMILVLLVLAAAYYCFHTAFYAPRGKALPEGDFDLPEGEIYEPYRDKLIGWVRQARAMPREEMTITAFDGTPLHGWFYEYAPGAPMEIMFHGYRGSAERDMGGGVQRCFRLGRSALIVDQRCSGKSGGNVITFGIREHRDCLSWAWHCARHFGPDRKIILTGISMGAATVMMAANKDLPPNVIGILADCGYTSPRAIMEEVIRKDMHLPPRLCWPFVKLGARLFGGFDPEEDSPLESLKGAKVPVIFFHGEADDFVPCDMSRENFEACVSRKRLVTVPDAGHGLCFPKDSGAYCQALADFFGPEASHS